MPTSLAKIMPTSLDLIFKPIKSVPIEPSKPITTRITIEHRNVPSNPITTQKQRRKQRE